MKSPLLFPLLLAAVGLHTAALPALRAEDTASSARTAEITRESMSMVAQPTVAPDGKTVAFAWDGDIWIMPAAGGLARRLTGHESEDSLPVFSPDGTQIAFNSRRAGGVMQVFTMPVAGGLPRQITANTEGSTIAGWYPDGKALLVTGVRDRLSNSYKPATRFLKVGVEGDSREEMLFDDYGAAGSISPDGKTLLFTREDHEPYRRGYHGSQAGQIWTFDLEKKTFKLILKGETGYRSPVWRPDGRGFYCLDSSEGAYNLAAHDFATGKTTLLTHGKDENAYTPALAGDGSVIVYRRGFDLFAIDPRKPGTPAKLPVFNLSDRTRDNTVRRTVQGATQAVFSNDGLECFFIAGGDVWVMDTTLAEPHAITSTAAEEGSVRLSKDGKKLYFLRDTGDGADLFEASRAEESKFWWENTRFTLKSLTTNREAKSNLRLSPDGKSLSYVRGRGDLIIAPVDGSSERVLLKSWNAPEYDWSPDGKWIAYAVEDDDFNRDVWLVPADGSAAPVNVSRHPDNDSAPSFSPDGKALAWMQRQGDGDQSEGKFGLAYVWLTREREQQSARDLKMESAREKMGKERSGKGSSDPVAKPAEPGSVPAGEHPAHKRSAKAAGKEAIAVEADIPPAPVEPGAETPDTDKPAPGTKETKPDAKPAKLPETKIDFDGLHRRVHSLPVPFSAKFDGFVWSGDSKKIGYLGALDGKPGVVAVDVTSDKPKPELLLTSELRGAQRLAKEKGYAGLTPEGVPAVATGTAITPYKFRARQEYDGVARRRVAFLRCWLLMRDNFYDGALNNLDWNAIRAKYEDQAANAVDTVTFDRIVNMMLGELNGSHLSYRSAKAPEAPDAANQWKVETSHPGLIFDETFAGPGLKVKSVVEDGPADRERSKIVSGEIVLAVDGAKPASGKDTAKLFEGPLDRDIALLVADVAGKERTVVIRPESYTEIRKKVRAQFLRETAAKVDKLSGGKLGYVYIAQMNWESFRVFEKAVYEQGHGKEGLIIDVRDNGGGFTTDHLLTILCQPRHAVTVPRDGGAGYPQDRHVYVAWNKPITVLCNQNSFSNAEVFSHAIKNIGRGKLVGVRTAGGVISTGTAGILDMGELRMPARGWYSTVTGEDYELNGAKPDYELWNEPGDLAEGRDRQLDKAVEVLLRDVAAQKPWPARVNAHANGR